MSGKKDCMCPRARHVHGTNLMYVADICRCFLCRVAHANKQAAYRNGRRWIEKGLVDGTGTRRRLQALAAIGVTAAEVGERIGVSRDVVSKYRAGTPGGRVSLETAANVAAAYDALWDKPRPGTDGLKAQWFARQQGWLPPLAYDDDQIDDPTAQPTDSPVTDTGIDEVAVAQAMGGRRVTLTKAERVEAVRQLTVAGYSKSQIVERLGTYWRQVERDRAEGRAA